MAKELFSLLRAQVWGRSQEYQDEDPVAEPDDRILVEVRVTESRAGIETAAAAAGSLLGIFDLAEVVLAPSVRALASWVGLAEAGIRIRQSGLGERGPSSLVVAEAWEADCI